MELPVVVVTGASCGLGAATARAAARLGAIVVLAARSAGPLQELAREIREAGGEALAIPGDVSREEDCDALIHRALNHFGRIDGLVNNAGLVEPIGPLAEIPFSDLDQIWAVNVLGPLRLARLALPALRQVKGRIINITSGAAGETIAGWGAYTTSKVALNHLTKILAAEEPTVTVLALRPGVLDTAMQAVIREKGKSRMAEHNYNWLLRLYEEGRLIPPELPARAVACLALYAPHEWSGENFSWDKPPVRQLVEAHWLSPDG